MPQWLLGCYAPAAYLLIFAHRVRATQLMTSLSLAHSLHMTCYKLLATDHHALLLRASTSFDLLRLTAAHYGLLRCTALYDYTLRPAAYYALLLTATYDSLRCTTTKHDILQYLPLPVAIDDYMLLQLTAVCFQLIWQCQVCSIVRHWCKASLFHC